MLQFVLIHPGANDFLEQGRIQGTLDIPLNELGQAEVERQIDGLRGLPIEVLYSSDSEPALGTARTIAKALDVKLKTLDRMQNLDHGLWQGITVEEVRTKHPKVYRQWQEQPESVCPPSGEMMGDARQRAQAVLAKLLKKHKRGAIALVVPEPLASIVRSILCQTEIGDPWKAGTVHGCFEVIDVAPVAAK